MTLRRCADVSPAAWIADAAIGWLQLVTFGPAGFEAYARLRYIPDPTGPGQVESDADLGADHLSDVEQARRALELLGRFTSTPEDCYFGVWEGWLDACTGPVVPAESMVVVPNRRYLLLRGSLADLGTWEGTFGPGSCGRPDFVWPADHSWCFASDVDPHWAGIGPPKQRSMNFSTIRSLTSSQLNQPIASPVTTDPELLIAREDSWSPLELSPTSDNSLFNLVVTSPPTSVSVWPRLEE